MIVTSLLVAFFYIIVSLYISTIDATLIKVIGIITTYLTIIPPPRHGLQCTVLVAGTRRLRGKLWNLQYHQGRHYQKRNVGVAAPESGKLCSCNRRREGSFLRLLASDRVGRIIVSR